MHFFGLICNNYITVHGIKVVKFLISNVQCILNFYIIASGSMSALPITAVFCSCSISCLPRMLLRYCLSDYEMVPVAPIITRMCPIWLRSLLNWMSKVKWQVIQYKVQRSEINWSELNEAKWSGMRWSEVRYRELGEGGRVFMEKFYRISKWWEVKDWGESVSELMIGKNNYNKLYTVLSCLGVFTFCTCCIVICLACIVASFKLSCV